MKNSNAKQAGRSSCQKNYFGKHCVVGLALVSAWLLPISQSHSQVLRTINPTIYSSKFTCGNQTQFSITSQTALEVGRYSTSFATFNPNSSSVGTVTVLASITGQPAVPVRSFTLPAFGTELINCTDILGVLSVLGVQNAVVGYVYVSRVQNDLEAQVVFTRTTQNSDGAAIKGAAMDVERIEPRPVRFSVPTILR